MDDRPLDATVVAAILALGDDDGAVGAQLFEQYLVDFALQIESMTQAVEDGDLDAIARLAHSVRGSAASFGAQRVVPLTLELEAAAGRGDAEGVVALVAALRTELQVVQRALTEAIERGRGEHAHE